MRKSTFLLLLLVLILPACSTTNADAPVDVNQVGLAIADVDPIQTFLPPTLLPGAVLGTPTPDGVDLFFPTYTPLPDIQSGTIFVTPTPGSLKYVVEDGDFWGIIAEKLDVSVEDLLAANNMSEFDVIYPGDELLIPASDGSEQSAIGTMMQPNGNYSEYFKVIPDSELVFGPLTARFNLADFVNTKGGYLSTYSQDVAGRQLTGIQVVDEISKTYSVNPKILLALLEYRSGWVTQKDPSAGVSETPIGYIDDYHVSLYRQLMFSANLLNEGFYGWREKKLANLILADDTTLVPALGVNAGTVGVLNLFAFFDDGDLWATDTGPNGIYATYLTLFGNPFESSVEPIVPDGLIPVTYSLPFRSGENWHFAGGPHGGWDKGSAWAAVDFAPPGDPVGCGPSDAWSTSIAPGLVVRSENGAVVVDLDGDGFEQTGWSILYMHMEARDAVSVGTFVKVGDNIGHPSCDGGVAVADHLHLARRYNGVWIQAMDQQYPFILGDYKIVASDVEYDGWLKSGNTSIEALDGYSNSNIISH